MPMHETTLDSKYFHSTNLDYHALNAQLNLVGEDGKLQLDADKEAVRQFFLQHVNQNTVFFHDLEEKIDYLIKNKYYEPETFEKYEWEFVKSLYKRAYAYKYRFETFLGAFKYYSSYTLKTFDGERYLERFEDRVTVTALYLADGDPELATHILDEVMSGRLQPATPTFANAGKKQRGELISCFPAGTPIDTSEGQVNIENLSAGDMVLSHDGKYHPVTEVLVNDNSENLVSVRHYGHKNPILCTPNHPILVWTDREVESLTEGDGADPENGFVWLEAQDIQEGDYVVATSPSDTRDKSLIDLFEFVSDDKSLVVHEGRIKKLNLDKKLRNTTPHSRSFVEVNQFVEENYSLGLILGWYLSEGYVSKRKNSDGSVTPNGIHFTLGAHEGAFQQELMKALQEVFGVEAKLRITTYDGSAKISAHSRVLGELFLSLAGTGFNMKKMGHDILTANHEFQRGVIHGLFRGDGHTTNGAMVLDLVNPEMIDATQLILTRLGVISRVRTYLNMSGKLTGQLTIPGIAGENEELILSIGKNLQNYTGLKGTGKNPKNNKFYKTVNGRVVFMVANVAATDDDPEKVYNLEVDETHTYSVRGVVVHNCFLVRTEDNMESIAQSIASSLQLSKRGGGVALNLTNLRAEGDPIKKIEGQASGVVPVMKLLEDSFSYANQLGSRQGAGAVYLNAHHPDIMKFLDTKRENADEKIRIKTLSLGVVIPDITFQLAKSNEDMYLFSPYDVEQEYGKPFSDISVSELYYEMVDNPNIRKKKINARTLFMTLAEIQFESGYPYILFEDTANRANPIEGRINMSNLCVTGDTRILTDMGYKKIADLYESQAEFNVVADNRAKSMDISAVGNSVVASSKVFKTADNAEVFELTTHTGHKIRATEWHKFYVKRDGNVVKVPLTEVREHDVLLIQKDAGVFGSIHDPKAAYVAGVVAARGKYFDGDLHFQLSIFDNPSAQKFYECAEFITDGFTQPLTDILERKGMTEGAHRLIPEFVWCGDEKTQERFIAGVVESSATVDKSSLKIVGSEDFMRDLQKLLLNHGIYTRVFEDRLVATYDDARELVSLSECHDVEIEEGGSLSAGFAMVKSIAAVGREDVFDVTVEDGHSLIFNGIVTGNCSEILQVNTPSTYRENGSYDTIGRDISCNLASLNVANAFDSPDFALTVETAVRALTSVSDLSNIESVPSVKRGNDASHAIGLGQMNLHGFLAREHMHYDSEEARDFANLYFYTVTYNAIRASHKIAKERGETFEGFENSKYATGEYFNKYIEKDWSKPETQRVRELLKKSNMVIPTPEDWKKLREDVMRDGIYNAYLQAVPPTGSISYINNSTSSIHPIVAPIEIRKEGKLGRVYYPVPYLSDETLPYYLDAYKIGPKAIIDMYAVATQHVDQGLSLTLFYPTTATTRDLNRSYVYAFSKGIKTLYYMRTRGEALAGTEVSGTAAEYCESCQL